MSGFAELGAAGNPLHGDISSYGMRCSVSAPRPVAAGELRRFAAALMTSIASACIAAGAKDVSHVKGFLEHASGFLHADVVGDPGTPMVEGRDGGTADTFTLAVNAVIYGLGADAVRRSTEAAVDQTVGRFGFARVSTEA
jgi:hypothetical protein